MAIIADQSLQQPQHFDFKLVLKGAMVFAGVGRVQSCQGEAPSWWHKGR